MDDYLSAHRPAPLAKMAPPPLISSSQELLLNKAVNDLFVANVKALSSPSFRPLFASQGNSTPSGLLQMLLKQAYLTRPGPPALDKSCPELFCNTLCCPSNMMATFPPPFATDSSAGQSLLSTMYTMNMMKNGGEGSRFKGPGQLFEPAMPGRPGTVTRRAQNTNFYINSLLKDKLDMN
ncbi:hypothetical protein HDE_05750 [Halotydeus destructor]|nr:hypothetical protein HDE_05750 [Halotydeus destructor]